MVYLTNQQKRFLSRLLKTDSIDCSNFSEDKMVIVKHLEHLGFLTAHRVSSSFYDPNTFETKTFYGAYLSVEISEKGKAYFVEVRSERRRFLIPVTISILALLISIISLAMQLPIWQCT